MKYYRTLYISIKNKYIKTVYPTQKYTMIHIVYFTLIDIFYVTITIYIYINYNNI
jgi:hypothetical protein